MDGAQRRSISRHRHLLALKDKISSCPDKNLFSSNQPERADLAVHFLKSWDPLIGLASFASSSWLFTWSHFYLLKELFAMVSFVLARIRWNEHILCLHDGTWMTDTLQLCSAACSHPTPLMALLCLCSCLSFPQIRFFLLQNRQGKTRLSKW